MLIGRLEVFGDTEKARLAREYLVMCEKRLLLAREAPRRQKTQERTRLMGKTGLDQQLGREPERQK